MRHAAVLLLLAAAPACVLAGPGSQVYHRNPQSERALGYARAVRIGDTLYLSGAPGYGAMPDALRQSYTALQATLAAHGLDFRHVVKETLYATDLDAVASANDVRLGFYAGETPAATWAGVPRLLRPAASVEVELIAVFPAAK